MEVRIEVESRSEKDLYTLDLECLSLHAIKGYHNIHAIILVVQGLSRELTDEKARGEQRLAQVRAVNGQFPVLSSSHPGYCIYLFPDWDLRLGPGLVSIYHACHVFLLHLPPLVVRTPILR